MTLSGVERTSDIGRVEEREPCEGGGGVLVLVLVLSHSFIVSRSGKVLIFNCTGGKDSAGMETTWLEDSAETFITELTAESACSRIPDAGVGGRSTTGEESVMTAEETVIVSEETVVVVDLGVIVKLRPLVEGVDGLAVETRDVARVLSILPLEVEVIGAFSVVVSGAGTSRLRLEGGTKVVLLPTGNSVIEPVLLELVCVFPYNSASMEASQASS